MLKKSKKNNEFNIMLNKVTNFDSSQNKKQNSVYQKLHDNALSLSQAMVVNYYKKHKQGLDKQKEK